MSLTFRLMGWIWIAAPIVTLVLGADRAPNPGSDLMALGLLSLILSEVMAWRRGERP